MWNIDIVDLVHWNSESFTHIFSDILIIYSYILKPSHIFWKYLIYFENILRYFEIILYILKMFHVFKTISCMAKISHINDCHFRKRNSQKLIPLKNYVSDFGTSIYEDGWLFVFIEQKNNEQNKFINSLLFILFFMVVDFDLSQKIALQDFW